MNLQVFVIRIAVVVLALRAGAQQMVCSEVEYASMLRKSPPTAEYLRYPIPPGARLDIQQSIIEGWPRRSWSETFVYKFPPGTKVAEVQQFFVQSGVYKARGTVYTDVNPNRKHGDTMRKVTEEDGVVTFTIFRVTTIYDGTPFGDVAWTAKQLRDHPPTATDLAVPLYPGAALDLDMSTRGIISNPSNYFYYSTPDSLQSVKAFYGIPPDETVRHLNRDDGVWVDLGRTGATRNGSQIRIVLSHEHAAGTGQPVHAPTSHLTGPGPAVAGPPPGWKPRQWKGRCERGPIAPIDVARP